MKKLILLVAICALALSGCSAARPDAQAAADIFDIKDKLFIAQINDIYANADDYIGKPIRYQGVFDSYPYNSAGDVFYSVIRYGPGCCGNDGNVGFEVVWDGEYPKQNDWVEAVGELERYEEYGSTYLRLQLTRLDVLPTRGDENVSQ